MESYKRKPNTICSICDKPLYRRPSELIRTNGKAYCCHEHYAKSCRKEKPCVICGKLILASKHAKTCSRECANKNRVGVKYDKKSVRKFPNPSARRLYILKEAFDLDSCMVEGCTYSNTYDIHRVIEGKDGGEYIIGNMFAICPNHHAEVTRKLIKLEKIDDCTLATTC